MLSHARWQAKRVEEPRSSDENRKSEAEEVEDQLGDDVEPMYAEEGVDDAPIDLSLKLEGTEEEEDQVQIWDGLMTHVKAIAVKYCNDTLQWAFVWSAHMLGIAS